MKPGDLVRIAPRCSFHDPNEIEEYSIFRNTDDWDTESCGKFTQRDVGIFITKRDMWVDVLVNGVVGYIYEKHIRRVE